MKETTFKDSSELRLYSLGVVVKGNSKISEASGKAVSTTKLKVSPIESMNVQKQGPIEEFNTVEAEWLAISQPNRISAPNIYPNQQVMLYKYANTEQYFWTTARNETDLQRVETAIFAFSNIPEGEGWKSDTDPVTMNPSNSYFLSIGGDGIHITTPDNRGEIVKYRVSLDCKNGKFELSDSKDNTISLNSKTGVILAKSRNRIHLKSDSLITLDAKDVSVKGKLYTGGDINCGGIVKHKGIRPGPDSAPSEDSIDKKAAGAGAPGVGSDLGAFLSTRVTQLQSQGVGSATGALTGAVSSGVAAVSGSINSVAGAASAAAAGVSSAVSGVANAAAAGVASAAAGVASAAAEVTNAAIDSASGVIDSVTGEIIGAVSAASASAGEMGRIVGSAGSLSGFTPAISSAASSVASQASQILDNFAGASLSAVESGTNFLQATGVGDAISNAQSGISNISTAVGSIDVTSSLNSMTEQATASLIASATNTVAGYRELAQSTAQQVQDQSTTVVSGLSSSFSNLL